jgi:hypothetical protein
MGRKPICERLMLWDAPNGAVIYGQFCGAGQ